MSPGNKIQYYRVYLGLSLSEVAAALSKPVEDIAAIELGYVAPTSNELAKLGSLFKLNPSVFADGVDPALVTEEIKKGFPSGLGTVPEADLDHVAQFMNYLSLPKE
jgi:transcriptional regulator with XRE-family HTH domain